MNDIGSQRIAAAAFARAAATTENYLREYGVGGILRNALAIYRKHFLSLLCTTVVFWAPFELLHDYVKHAELAPLTILTAPAAYIGSQYAVAVIARFVADIYVGNPASVARAVQRVKGTLLVKLVWTNVLSGVVCVLGLIFLVVPGVVWMLWTLVASVVVAIEGRSGWDALMRSRELGRGYYVRNGVIMLLSLLVYVVVLLLVAVAIGAVTDAVVGLDFFDDSLAMQWLFTALTIAWVPFVLINIILIYHDMRVRKEAYDRQALIRDMMR